MSLGLYIHVPFCASKCAYCDFYSFAPTAGELDSYTNRITDDLEKWAARLGCAADTLYFGGGTPSLLGGRRISRIVAKAKECFGLHNAEITVECNPADDLEAEFIIMAEAGVNRISIGAQSGHNFELAALSRRHSVSDIESTVAAARRAGIENISLDLMLGIPFQTSESLSATINRFAKLGVSHISAYLLKVEPGTPMEKRVSELPEEDATADLYLQACRELAEAGYSRYEISNFCRDNKFSRHNVKYWQCEEYLGLGPSAHSFIDGRRFYYERDYKAYMAGADPTDDGCGDVAERLMLALRLDCGVEPLDFCQRNLLKSGEKLLAEMECLQKAGIMKKQGNNFSFTDKGALVSNACIVRLVDALGF